jgi:hypothetical protein
MERHVSAGMWCLLAGREIRIRKQAHQLIHTNARKQDTLSSGYVT